MVRSCGWFVWIDRSLRCGTSWSCGSRTVVLILERGIAVEVIEMMDVDEWS